MTRMLLAVGALAVVLPTALTAATSQFPSRIDLPDGFRPEGIAIAGVQFYAGSIPTGAVYRGSLRTGQGSLLVQAQTGRAAIGMKVDRGRLFVAGGDTGMAFVYDARTGANLTSYQLSTGGSFVNDVVVTQRAAWFTDSFKPVLYRVPLGPGGQPGATSAVRTVQLSGDYQHQAGAFNVNGIDATPNGKTLVVVQSGTGRLFTVTPPGVTRAISLAGGQSVVNGDGILLDGKTLYVAQNRSNLVAKIALSPSLRSGRVVRRISNPGFDVPTTLAEQGSRLYAVNARFTTTPTPTTDYWATGFRK
jgi:sugar lactone lactonase YvrE